MLLISLISFYITSVILFYIVVRIHTVLKTKWAVSDNVLGIALICMLFPILNLIMSIYLYVKLKPKRYKSITNYIFGIKE